MITHYNIFEHMNPYHFEFIQFQRFHQKFVTLTVCKNLIEKLKQTNVDALIIQLRIEVLMDGAMVGLGGNAPPPTQIVLIYGYCRSLTIFCLWLLALA